MMLGLQNYSFLPNIRTHSPSLSPSSRTNFGRQQVFSVPGRRHTGTFRHGYSAWRPAFMCPEWVCKEAPGGATAPKVLGFRGLRVIVIGFKGLSDRTLFLGILVFVAASLRTSALRIMRVIVAEFICRINNKGLMPQSYNAGQAKRIPAPKININLTISPQ